MNVEIERDIGAPADHVWQLVQDIGTTAEWNPEVLRSRSLGAQRTGLGARRRCEFDEDGRKWVEETVTGYDERMRSLTVRLDEGPARPPLHEVAATLVVTPVPGGCRVKMTFHLTPRGLGQRLVALAAPLALRGVGRRILAGLDAHARAPAEVAGAAL